MSHTYSSLLFHCVFSTRERQKLISLELQSRLWAYMGGIAREHHMKALAIGGTDDHAHLLLSLPPSHSIATAMREIKSGSSRWMHETPNFPLFGWLDGYGAFSIGQAQIETTVAYIAKQNDHHCKQDFQAEFLAFLKKHRIEFDPVSIWD